MIGENDRVLISGEGREYWVRAGAGPLSTDKGMIDLSALVGCSPGDEIRTHLGCAFFVRIPRATDFFVHARRSGAPMLPKDIGMVIAYTGMNRRDTVLDAGTGSGIAAIFFGGIAGRVITCEHREEFARLAAANVADAGLTSVEVVCADVMDVEGEFDVVHLDLQIREEHVLRAHELLRHGGYLATYTPFLEQTNLVMDSARDLFSEVHTYEIIERELTRSQRGTRPSTRVCHSGYITIARKVHR
ncbi:MAG: methyltransferase domain-containing protein [Methanomicrobiaceae archaeon]|nr:methyltransferase domain-containing protein [Methanomicrobiaceae archaeon]